MAEYNHAATGAAADALGKGVGDMAIIGEGPYQALDISIDAKLEPLPTLTLGGLRVDEETGGVLGVDGETIEGLYAAGRTAIGICSNIYVSGLSSADCTFSGRRAGKAAFRRGWVLKLTGSGASGSVVLSTPPA
ncbi:MAG: FAD-binding protein [Rhodospirillales bacterium]